MGQCPNYYVGRGLVEARAAGAFIPGFGSLPLRPSALRRQTSSFDSMPSSLQMSPAASPADRAGSQDLFTPPHSVIKKLHDLHMTSPREKGHQDTAVDLVTPVHDKSTHSEPPKTVPGSSDSSVPARQRECEVAVAVTPPATKGTPMNTAETQLDDVNSQHGEIQAVQPAQPVGPQQTALPQPTKVDEPVPTPKTRSEPAGRDEETQPGQPQELQVQTGTPTEKPEVKAPSEELALTQAAGSKEKPATSVVKAAPETRSMPPPAAPVTAGTEAKKTLYQDGSYWRNLDSYIVCQTTATCAFLNIFMKTCL